MKKTSSKHFFAFEDRKYEYTLTPNEDGVSTHVFCKDACIDQGFLNEDLANLVEDLPNILRDELRFQKQSKKKARQKLATSS